MAAIPGHSSPILGNGLGCVVESAGSGPVAAPRHAMTYDTERERIVLFGGEVETTTGGMPVVQRLGRHLGKRPHHPLREPRRNQRDGLRLTRSVSRPGWA